MPRILFSTKLIPIVVALASQTGIASAHENFQSKFVGMGTLLAERSSSGDTTSKDGQQQTKKKKHRHNSDDFENESPGDMNLFSLKPSIINDSYYASGRNERTQKTSPILPPGAPIPDSDNYVMPDPKGYVKGVETTASSTELHSALLDGNLAQSMKNWSTESNNRHRVNLTLQVTDCSESLIKELKSLDAQILSTGTSMSISIPAHRIQSVTELKQVNRISLSQPDAAQ